MRYLSPPSAAAAATAIIAAAAAAAAAAADHGVITIVPSSGMISQRQVGTAVQVLDLARPI